MYTYFAAVLRHRLTMSDIPLAIMFSQYSGLCYSFKWLGRFKILTMLMVVVVVVVVVTVNCMREQE